MPDFGKLMDKAKELLGQHPQQADEGMEKTGDAADKKTGGRYGDQIKQGEQRAEDYMGTSQAGGQQGQDQGGQDGQGQDQGGQENQ